MALTPLVLPRKIYLSDFDAAPHPGSREPAVTDFAGELSKMILQLPHTFDKRPALTSLRMRSNGHWPGG